MNHNPEQERERSAQLSGAQAKLRAVCTLCTLCTLCTVCSAPMTSRRAGEARLVYET